MLYIPVIYTDDMDIFFLLFYFLSIFTFPYIFYFFFSIFFCTFTLCTCITCVWVVIPASPIRTRFTFLHIYFSAHTLHTRTCGRRWLNRQHVHTHLLFRTFTFLYIYISYTWVADTWVITPVSPHSCTCTFIFFHT